MEKFRPMILAFNGKYAASVFLNRKSIQVKYGIQNCPSEPCKIFVLPSTSGNANGHWNIEHWRDLATHLKSL
jgi:TDG/mug DNA glycosylase family protein